MTANQPPAAPQGRNLVAVAVLPLVRFALLAGPLALAIVSLRHSPVVCSVVCAAVLALWLSVDAGPFRAGAAPAESRVMSLPSFRNLARPQWWNGLFCRLIILGAMVYSKLNV